VVVVLISLKNLRALAVAFVLKRLSNVPVIGALPATVSTLVVSHSSTELGLSGAIIASPDQLLIV